MKPYLKKKNPSQKKKGGWWSGSGFKPQYCKNKQTNNNSKKNPQYSFKN
jgi:hypothetical protein